MMVLRLIFRVFVLLTGICLLLPIVAAYRVVVPTSKDFGLHARQFMAQKLIKLWNIKIIPFGNPVQGNYLYVSNHQSYLDPLVIMNWILFLPVAKMEVKDWFLIGYGLHLTGTIFVKRESRESRLNTIDAVRKSLRQKLPVLVFPEGTTTAANSTIPFRPGCFRVATEENIGVIPIAIRYRDPQLAFINDDKFVPHLVKVLGRSCITVEIHFSEPVFDDVHEILLQRCKTQIDNMLQSRF